jgi:DNA (cytosine-5)-methyltransferase 1
LNINNIELFAGAGGMALGLEKAGFEHVLLNEFDKYACKTLRRNRPRWKVIEGNIENINWEETVHTSVDLVSGGFPCQSFSHSGKRLGLEDTRGTLFYEFARCVKAVKPTCFLAENVKGLLTHDKGNTIALIIKTFEELGYHVFKPLLLNSNNYEVAQKRERIFLFGVKKELTKHFSFNKIPGFKPLVLKDVLFPGDYYPLKNKDTLGHNYSKVKKDYFDLIPEGGNWKSLPIALQKKYLGNMFESGGGKTGVLKRLSFNEASVTILTSPSQKQTERCHPTETRPLTIRETARIQSFPDNWYFEGSLSSQYKQIGNAVPVNLAKHIGSYIYNQIEKLKKLDL